jgi:tetratricopeptide (TPR) repeat protein
VRRLILETYECLGQRDHFRLLGVALEASAAELRASYAQLARALHPDSCRDPLLADVDDKREKAFLGVRTAYEALRNPATRAAHEAEVRRRRPRPAAPTPPPPDFSSPSGPAAPRPDGASASSPPASTGPGPPEPGLEERLEQTIAAGEELLRDGQYWEAIQQIEPTLVHARGSLAVRARLALARASSKNPQWVKKAEAHLQSALHEDPARVETYLLLGDLYRDSHLPVRATAMFRKALELQPGNRHALREIARLEEAKSPPPGGSSLLGFLKKR